MFIDKISQFNPKLNEPLASYTTWKIGGPAEILVETDSSNNLLRLIQLAIEHDIPYTVLGKGANVLISDNGLKGLVIINKSRTIEILDKKNESESISEDEENQFNPWIQPRHGENDDNFYTFEDLDYIESGKRVRVKFDSGVDLPYATAWTLKNNVTGLQFFAGIPSTLGGALYNNIHGGTKHFSDNFYSATVIAAGKVQTFKYEDFNFGYDQSILRENKNIIVLDVILNLYHGDVKKAKFVANEWAKRKRIQPRQTAGCTFKNIPLDKQKELGFPTPSVGYIVDKILGWKGRAVGGVIVSNTHANFIENTGNGKSSEVLQLINDIKIEVKNKLDLDLETEINLLGY